MKYLKNFSINENVQQAKLLLTKLNKTQEDPNFVKIKNMLNGNGYTYWFTKMFFEKEVPMEELENVWRTIKSESNIISKFETPIVKLENTEKFWDEYYAAKGLSGAKSIYNEFPAAQKKFVDLSNANDIQLLSDFFKDKEKANLLKKISRYHSREQLVTAIKTFVYNKTNNEFDVLLKTLQNTGCKIKYQDKSEDIIIVTVDYSQLKRFGSDTSWCIVGFEHTFDSYNDGELSQQFIIFLLDKTDIYSKIGVTTDITGYNTGHLKNDNYINLNDISKILEERGCNPSVLFPDKEAVSAVNWSKITNEVLQKIGFSEEEIFTKKRRELMKKNWDKLPVEYLMYSGFKKTEIVKRKNSFGDDGSDYIRLGTNKYFYSNKDLDQFTKAEIAKYDILNKIVLRLQDLNQFNKEEIVEKNLISRVRKITLSDLGPLGFSFDEIKDYAKTDKFREDPVADFIKGKTRDRVLKIALSSWLDGYKNGRDHSNMTSIERSEIRAMLIGILNPTEEEFPLDFALKLFDKNYFKEHGSTSIVECAKFFSRIYKDPSYENVKSIVSIFGNNNSLTSCAELIASGYWNEKAIKVLKKDVLVDRWLTPDYRTMTQLQTTLKNNQEVYDYIYNTLRTAMVSTQHGRYGRFIIDNSYRHSSGSKCDLEATIHNLKFWCVSKDYTIEQMYNIFYGKELGIPGQLDKLLEFFKECGYDITKTIKVGPNGEQKTPFNLMYSITSNYNKNITLAKYCVDNDIDIEGTCKELYDWVQKQKTIPSYDLEKIKEVFNKSKEYKKKFSDIEKNNNISIAFTSAKDASGYHKSEEATISDAQKWYDKYWNTIKDVDLSTLKEESFESNNAISIVIILAKLGKLDELENLKYNLFAKWSDIGTFAKLVAERLFYNHRRAWGALTEDVRKIIFNWLNKKAEKHISDDPEKAAQTSRYMLIDWYLFDRDKLEKYLLTVKKLRSHKSMCVSGLMKFVASQGDFEYIEHILKTINITKSTKKSEYHHIRYQTRLDYVASDDGLFGYEPGGRYGKIQGEKIQTDSKKADEYEKRYKELIDKYIKPDETIKESILKWNDFKV